MALLSWKEIKNQNLKSGWKLLFKIPPIGVYDLRLATIKPLPGLSSVPKLGPYLVDNLGTV